VTLKSDRDGQHVDVKAERVVVNLADGSFEVRPATKPTVAAPVAIPGTSVFDFYQGFFR
jgi:hypothetical protein